VKITEIETPSGQVFFHDDLELLKLMAKYGFIRQSDQPFELKSGILSHVYVYGREDVTDNPELEWLIGRKIAKLIIETSEPLDNQPCLIGIPSAGTALAQAAAMVSFREQIMPNGYFICHRVMVMKKTFMKEALKKHGAHPKWVNGEPRPNLHTYWTVDNVVTDGATKIETNERLRASGYPVETIPSFILVDRQQGGVKRMEQAGFKRIVVAFYLLDLAFAMGEIKNWPKSVVRLVEEEIKAHQFL